MVRSINMQKVQVFIYESYDVTKWIITLEQERTFFNQIPYTDIKQL